MSTLIDLRRRIRSVRNSQQVTQAMKTVSTAKFRKAQRVLIDGRSFWHVFPDLINRLAFWTEAKCHPLLDIREEKKAEIIVVAADKGLAGAFNSNLLSRACNFIEESALTRDIRLGMIGKKAVNFFKKMPYPVDFALSEKTDRLKRKEIIEISKFLMRQYTLQNIDAVYIVYNEFKSLLAPKITVAKILPPAPDPGRSESASWEPGWEPKAEGLVRYILPVYVEAQIYHVLHESQASEQAARMMAMDNATKNAQELIDDLILVLNKIRQANITKELLEIMTAVEALAETSA